MTAVKRRIITKYNSVYLIVFIMCAAAFIYYPPFFTYGNINLMMRQGAALGILTMGQIFVISCGFIDLSVVAIMQITVAIFMMFVKRLGPQWLALGLICALAAAVFIGFLNGFIVARLNVQSFLSTLFMGIILVGVRKAFSGVTPLCKPPQIITDVTKGVWVISYCALWFALIAIIMAIMTNRTVFGRQVMMVGTNRNAALFSGVKVKNVIIIAYVISGISALLAGIVATGYLGFADQTSVGDGMEMGALVAAVLGGNFLSGGRASVSGAVGGVIATTIMINIVVLFGLPIQYQYILKGVVLLTVMFISAKRNR